MNRIYEELLIAYIKRFGEAFPTDMAPQDDEEVMDIVEKCLLDNKPYDPYADGANPEDLY